MSRRARLVAALGIGLLAALPGCASAPPPPVTAPPATHDAMPDMDTYYVVLLRRGPSLMAEDSPALKELQAAHIANIGRMLDEGDLVVAGPFLETPTPGSLAGLYILRAATHEEAAALAGTDPMVRNGRLVPEILRWMGPASLGF
jgi:uncharacterized protein YciI